MVKYYSQHFTFKYYSNTVVPYTFTSTCFKICHEGHKYHYAKTTPNLTRENKTFLALIFLRTAELNNLINLVQLSNSELFWKWAKTLKKLQLLTFGQKQCLCLILSSPVSCEVSSTFSASLWSSSIRLLNSFYSILKWLVNSWRGNFLKMGLGRNTEAYLEPRQSFKVKLLATKITAFNR